MMTERNGMQKKIFLCIVVIAFILNVTCAYALFERDRASYKAQKDEWSQAHSLLTGLLVNDPEQADLLYDTGVVAFNNASYEEAESCFEDAAQLEAVSDDMREKAFFNCGNSCVEQKKWKRAVEQYEKALSLNPDNEKTKHNLSLAKKMLEEQEQQQQNQEQQKDNNQQKNQDNSESNQDNKDTQDSSNKEQPEQQEKDKQEDRENNLDNKKNNEQRQQQGDENKGEQPQGNDNREREEDSPHNSGDEKQQQKNGNDSDHETTPQKEQNQGQSGSQDKTQQQQNQEEAGTSDVEQYGERVARILSAIEEHDAQVNKKMMLMHVKQAAGGYDKNQNNY